MINYVNIFKLTVQGHFTLRPKMAVISMVMCSKLMVMCSKLMVMFKIKGVTPAT
jgi:hypothetical protein